MREPRAEHVRRQDERVRQQRLDARVVRRDDQRRARLDRLRAQQLERRRGVLVVERGGRLVGEQQGRPVDDGARDRDALRLALRQLAGQAVREVRDLHRLRAARRCARRRARRRRGAARAAGCRATLTAPIRCSRCGTRPTVRPRQRSRSVRRERRRGPGSRRRCGPRSAASVRRSGAAASTCRCPTGPPSSHASPLPARHDATATASTSPWRFSTRGELEHRGI